MLVFVNKTRATSWPPLFCIAYTYTVTYPSAGGGRCFGVES